MAPTPAAFLENLLSMYVGVYSMYIGRCKYLSAKYSANIDQESSSSHLYSRVPPECLAITATEEEEEEKKTLNDK